MSNIEKSSGNVYSDLGIIGAEAMLVKAQLAARISEIIKERNWTQSEAASVLGISQPKLSNLLRGQFRGISEEKMLACLTRLGRNIQIVIGPEQPATGKVEVLFESTMAPELVGG